MRKELRPLFSVLFDVRAEIEPGKATAFGFDVRGHKVEYSVSDKKISSLGRSAPLAPQDGKIKLQILVDRTSIEVFGNDGRVSMASCFLPNPADKSLGIFANGGEAKILSLKVYQLRSAWTK